MRFGCLSSAENVKESIAFAQACADNWGAPSVGLSCPDRGPKGRLALPAVKGRDAGMVSVHGEGDGQLFQGLPGVCAASGPVVDSVNGAVMQARLKSAGVFPQVMQQPGQFRFRFQPQRLRETLGQGRHVAQVRGQQLPLRLVGVRRPVRVHRRMRVVVHLGFRVSSDLAALVLDPGPPGDKDLLSEMLSLTKPPPARNWAQQKTIGCEGDEPALADSGRA